MTVLLQTIFWNIGFFQPVSNTISYFLLYFITVLIPIFIYLPFIIIEVKNSVKNISSKRSILSLIILAWCVLQHVFYYGHQYEIAMMRWNVSTILGYFLLFIWSYESKDQEWYFLDKEKYLIFFLTSSVALGVTFKLAFLELFETSRAWILYVGVIIVCVSFAFVYLMSRKRVPSNL